jgi:hypothetical protein
VIMISLHRLQEHPDHVLPKSLYALLSIMTFSEISRLITGYATIVKFVRLPDSLRLSFVLYLVS